MKTIMHLLITFLVIISTNSFSQTGTIKGRAIEGATGRPVEFASVTILSAIDSSLVKGELTDTTGRFELINLKQGKYILVISSVEYQKVSKGPLLIDFNQELLDAGDVKMITDVKTLQEVIVRGSKPIIEHRMGSIVMNMDNKFFKTSTNGLDVLKKAPGIQVKPDGSILMRNTVAPKIFIDGKPSPMNADEINNYLTSLSPEQIESIEIINNPSAIYDAEYKSIIDIRLKRDKNLGWKGTYSSTFTQNTFSSLNNDMNLNYKTSKFAYNLKVGYNDRKRLYINQDNQILANGDLLTGYTEIPIFQKSFSYNLGLDYSVSKNQTVGIRLNGYSKDNDNKSNTRTVKLRNNLSIQDLITQNNSTPKGSNASGTAYYEGNFNKSRLSINTIISSFRNTDYQDIRNNNSNGEFVSAKIGNLQNNILSRSTQIDYSKEIGKGTFEVGGKLAFITTKNNLRYDTLAVVDRQIWNNDARQTNMFTYNEYITAGYLAYGKKINKFSYKVGLRGENTKTNADLQTQDSVVVREYLNWLPSLNLSYTIDENNSLSIDLARKLQRPDFSSLNPFTFYINPYQYVVGNPFLLAAISNTAIINYTYKDLSVSVSVDKNENPISQIPFYDKSTNISFFRHENLKGSSSQGLEVSYPYSFTKWWKTQNTFGYYLMQSEVYYSQKLYANNSTFYYLQGSQVFSLPKETIFELSYNYSSKSFDALYVSSSTGTVGLSLQRMFLNKTLNVKFNFNDIFYTYVPKAEFRHPEIYNWNNYQKYDTKAFVLQLNYNFGKSTYKQKQSSSSDEEKRANKK
jgi:Outer membrane protein beta-barrel family/CarboxypepD_reg-like domain/TonB-dependent Receptor Plug Domain